MLYQQLEEENRALIQSLETKDVEIQNLRKNSHWLESRLSLLNQAQQNNPNTPDQTHDFSLLKAKIQELKAEIDQCLYQLKSLT